MDVDFDQKIYWNMLQIPLEEQELLQNALLEGIEKTFSNAQPIELIDAISFLDYITNTYIQEVQDSSKKKPLSEGIEIIKELYKEKPRIIGITGEPGTGKSTLLNKLENEGYVCIDEYWNQGQDYKLLQKNNYAKEYKKTMKRLRNGESTIVAAAFLETADISNKLVLESNSETRFANINSRKKEKNSSDSIRVQYQEFYKHFDLIMYGVQKIDANMIINTSTLTY